MAATYQKAYIAWKAHCKVYRHNKGEDKVVDLTVINVQEHCAEYVCEIELVDFLLLENSEITDILDKYFDINEANYYETTLLSFYMKPNEFAREDVEDYCAAFLVALQKRVFLYPNGGGAHPQITNKMFLAGLQTSHSRVLL